MSGTKAPRCPFYPESCLVEYHPNMQHKWRDVKPVDVAKKVVWPVTNALPTAAPVTNAVTNASLTVRGVTNTDVDSVSEKVSLPASAPGIPKMGVASKERMSKWREANREKNREKQRELMRKKRASKGS